MKYRVLLFLLSCLFVNNLASQNLITNGDFESGESGVGFNINGVGYTLVSPPYSGTTVPGNYAFATNPQVVNTTFISGTDHTSGTGKMMVFDGNTQSGIQYLYRLGTTDAGLCGLTVGEYYQFSYWVKTISSDVTDINTRPNIKLLATGVEDFTFVAGSSLAPLPADGWQQRIYTFKAVDACVTVEMWNVNYSALGNDFALDDFALHALPSATISADETYCFNGTGASVTFTGANGVAPYTFTYNINGGPNQTIVSSGAGDTATLPVPTTAEGISDYNLVSVSYGNTPVFSNIVTQQTATITVRNLTATISGDITTCPGTRPVLTFNGSPNATVTFSSDDGTQYTQLLDNAGVGTWSAPFATTLTTSYLLESITDGNCTKILTGIATVTINNASGCGFQVSGPADPNVKPNKVYIGVTTGEPICAGYNDTTKLNAIYNKEIRKTTSYTVESFPSQAGISYEGTNRLAVDADDQWSPVQNLLFDFYFYGNKYNKTLVGANGLISFNVAPIGPEIGGGQATGQNQNGCSWQIPTQSLNTNPGAMYEYNAIYGVFQDIIPPPGSTLPGFDSNAQNINYYQLGESPNQSFVTNVLNFPQFSCGTSVGLQTYQIVIYESTNYIDVNVNRRTPCTGWNSGNGIIGIINQNGTQGLAAPGRDATSPDWTILPANATTYRFKPTGPILPYTVKWYVGNESVPFAVDIDEVNVIVDKTAAFYRVEVTYTNPDNTTFTVYDYVTLDQKPPLNIKDPLNKSICVSTTQTNYSFNIDQDTYILDGANPLDYPVSYHTSYDDAFYDASNIPASDISNYQVPAVDLPKTIYTRIVDMTGGGCVNIRPFVLSANIAAGTFSYPNTAAFFCTSTATPVLPQPTGLTPGGKYSADEPGLSIDPDTGALDLQNSLPGFYVVTYKISSATCPYTTTFGPIEVRPCCSVTSTPDFSVCSNVAVSLTATGTDPSTTYVWTGPGLAPNTTGSTINFTPPTAAGDYTYTVEGSVMGQPCDISGVTKITVVELPTVAFSSAQLPTQCVGVTPTVSFTGTPGASFKYNYDEEGVTGQITAVLDASGNYSFTTPPLTMYAKYELVDVTFTTTTPTTTSCVTSIPNSFREFNVGLPDATITTPGSSVPVCSGSGSSFTISGTAGAVVDISLSNAAGTQVLPSVTLDATTGLYVFQTGNLSVTGNNVFSLTQVTSNGTCSKSITTQSFTVDVKALPVVSSFVPATAFVCAGANATVNVIGTPSATINYNDGISNKSLTLDISGNGTFQVPSTGQTSPMVIRIFDITTAGPTACITTFSPPLQISVDIYDLPTITADPQNKVLCPSDTTVSFSVTATGTNITYAWYKVGSTVALDDLSGDYSGTSTPTLTINTPSPTDIGFYYCRVSNPTCGFDDSAPAELQIDAQTVITSEPSGLTQCENTPLTQLTVTATGVTGLFYEWYFGTSAATLAPLPNGGNISGAATNQLSIGTITPANAGFYQVWITNSCPGVVKSAIVEIKVTELPEVTGQSADVNQCSGIGTPITLSVQTNVPVTTYRWYRNGIALSDASGVVTGSGTANLTINAPAVSDTGDYTCLVTNSCGTDLSSIIKVRIPAAPSIITGPVAVPAEAFPLSRCEGQFFTLRVDVPTGFTVRWQFEGVDLVDGGRISGAGTTTLNVTSVQISDAGDYTAVITGDAICSELVSNSVEVIINAIPVITQQPQSKVICEGSQDSLSVAVQDPTGLQFEWYFNGTKIDATFPGVTGYDTNVLTFTSATAAQEGNYYSIIKSGCPDLLSQQARIIVVPLPQATITAGISNTICSGNSSDILFAGTPSAVVTYTVNGGTPQTITLNPSGTAVLITGILDQTTSYDLVSVERNDIPSCPNPVTGSAVITVNQAPSVALDQEGYICLDPVTGVNTTTYLLDTGLSATDYSFEWYFNNALTTETGPSIQADQGGMYRVVITDLTSSTNCTAFATAPIATSTPPATITAEATTTFFADSGTIVVTVTPPGDYEYRLDNGPYQSDSTFTNVSTLSNTSLGAHTVYARDLKACDELEFDIRIIDYPKYFTPNGDGYHDTWNISTLSEQSNAKIYIFDRFGKLVKQISTTGSGWDGTLNGKPLSADDYWFVIKYSEQGINKEFRAHFSLKR